MKLDALVFELLNNIDYVWTFLLILSRFTGLILILPGIGQGMQGIRIRVPAIMAFSLASMTTTKIAPMPPDLIMLALSVAGEFSFGFLIGLIPYILVVGVQAGGQLATNTMGLSATQLFDPTIGASSTDLARIQGDLVVLTFLMLGGHHVLFQATSGLSGTFTPGAFNFDGYTAQYLTDRVHDVLKIGIMISAPVIVALLLTQFVLGIVTKAVPTVNIFIASFPLTIGIGLVMTTLALPEVLNYVYRDMATIDNKISIVVESVTDYRAVSNTP